MVRIEIRPVMHTGRCVFAQITMYLPQRQFRGIVAKYPNRALGRLVAQVLRILGSSLLVKDDLPELFGRGTDDGTDDGQLEINFNCLIF